MPGPDLPPAVASCTFKGSKVVLIVAKDSGARDRILGDTGKKDDGVSVLTRDNWAVESRDADAILAAQDKLGGEVR